LSAATRDTCTESEENVIFDAKVGGKKCIEEKIKSKYTSNSKKITNLFYLKKRVKISLFKILFRFYVSGKLFFHLLSGSQGYLQLQFFTFYFVFETFPGIRLFRLSVRFISCHCVMSKF